jgi:hypothetical protein
MAAMVNHDDGAFECLSQGISAPNIRRHILVVVLRATKGPVQCIQDNSDGLDLAKLFMDGRNERRIIAYQLHIGIDQEKSRVTHVRILVTKSLRGKSKSLCTVEGAINNRALAHAVTLIIPPAGHMHHKVKGPEALTTLAGPRRVLGQRAGSPV